jgi:enoyl-CoA hydratase
MSELTTPTPTPGTLHLHKQGHVATIVFDNPAKFNAMNYDMWTGLPQRIQECVDDENIRLIVLTGAGDKAFVSGADISQFGERRNGGDADQAYNRATEAAYASVLDCPKPTLAKIRGICMGGGLGLALNCDVRMCSTDARFRMPAGRLGLGYAYAGVKRFTEIVGFAHTPDLFFSARIFGAEEARHMHLVQQVLAPDAFEAGVQAYIDQVCENAPMTLAAAKRALLELRKDPAQRDVALVQQMVQACFASQDYKEGRKAFAEKRKPDFKSC